MPKAKPDGVLEVEDEEQRERRIRTLLERLNETSRASASTGITPDPMIPRISDRRAYAVEPPTELLSRVQAFLPAIHASNEALAQRNPEDLDIENVGEDEEHYIEMNLGLGVFKAKRRRKNMSSKDSDESDSSSESSSQSSSESHEISSESSDRSRSPDASTNTKHVASWSIKPLPTT
ncbi:hypothetical protein EDD16DRAFT_1700773 [Pisolithus croceorrhizus]|nr:hypothetical protein EDD16DRAFT_1700773 [Pisolithus croceorrhizus]KAI6135116.1 hypothetical protein EV401DRAFT_2063431 [Pisolithus croceorrhizus]KAI6163199.1 hypothetical protein EDD17DRAFT_1756704 [Pisolithus thermaeus]